MSQPSQVRLSPAVQPFGAPEPSARAGLIVRGAQILLSDLGFASLPEVSLANGRRADIMALSGRGEIVILEVKSCLNDFRTDRKWPEYAPYCDRFFFAVDCDFPRDRLPDEAGLVVADAFGGAILREAAPQPLAAPRRKAVTLAFARLAATRLLRSGDAPPQDGPLVIP